MRVLFVNPPSWVEGKRFNRPGRFPNYPYASKVLTPPILLAYATSYIRNRDHDVSFIDTQASDMNTATFLNEAEKISPDVTVFETSTPSFYNDKLVAAATKERTGCQVVFVGTHVSALPEESLEGSAIDAVVMGEYEPPLGEYLEKGAKDAKGIAYKKNGKVIINPPAHETTDFDAFPYPARDLMPNDQYFDPILKNPFTYFLTGRGCPYRCSFCNWPQVLWGHNYRVRSPKNIVDEIDHLNAEYNFKSIQFNDDTFTVNREHAIAVCDEIISRGTKVEWAAYSRADFGSVPEDIPVLKKLRQAGCFLLKVGVESGNQNILNLMRKGTMLATIKKGIKTMMEFGFHVHGTLMFGMPGETEESIEETIDFAKELDPTTVQFSTAVPFPKTEFHDYLSKRNLIFDKDWSHQLPGNPTYNYEHLSEGQIKGALKKAYRRYYFRKKYVAMAARDLFREPKTVLTNVYTLMKYSI